MSKLPSLNEIIQYQNPLVIKRFKRNFPQYRDQAENIFKDMLKYLWLCRKYEHDIAHDPDNPSMNFNCVMHKEMVIIDEMWHSFILITKDYADFCHHYFGGFLHHIPEVGDRDEDIERSSSEMDLFEKQLELFLSYVYDHLGEETLKSWFAVYLTEPLGSTA